MSDLGMIPRYFSGYDCPDEYTCDAIIVDRTTGEIVSRYDAANPANVRADYGAKSDRERLACNGHDIDEKIHTTKSKITDQQLVDFCRRSSYDD